MVSTPEHITVADLARGYQIGPSGRIRVKGDPNAWRGKLHDEERLQIELVAWLRANLPPRAVVTSIPADTPIPGRLGAMHAAKRRAMGCMVGIPDILIVHKGRPYFLELKRPPGDRQITTVGGTFRARARPPGRLSDEQKACHAAILDAGALVATVTSIAQAKAILAGWGLI